MIPEEIQRLLEGNNKILLPPLLLSGGKLQWLQGKKPKGSLYLPVLSQGGEWKDCGSCFLSKADGFGVPRLTPGSGQGKWVPAWARGGQLCRSRLCEGKGACVGLRGVLGWPKAVPRCALRGGTAGEHRWGRGQRVTGAGVLQCALGSRLLCLA